MHLIKYFMLFQETDYVQYLWDTRYWLGSYCLQSSDNIGKSNHICIHINKADLTNEASRNEEIIIRLQMWNASEFDSVAVRCEHSVAVPGGIDEYVATSDW